MKTKHELELADVNAAAAEAQALKNDWAVAIAIVHDGGHLLWLQRLDGAPAVSVRQQSWQEIVNESLILIRNGESIRPRVMRYTSRGVGRSVDRGNRQASH